MDVWFLTKITLQGREQRMVFAISETGTNRSFKKIIKKIKIKPDHYFNHILANIIGSMHPPGKDTLEQSNFHLLMSTSELRGLLETGHTQSWPPGPKSQPAWIFPWWEGSSPERFFKPPQLFWNSQDKTSHFTKKTEATVRILSNSFLLTNLHSYTHTFPFLLPSNYK